MFVHCRFSQQVWLRLRQWSKANFPVPDCSFNCTEDWRLAARELAPKHLRSDFDTFTILVHWQIWKERNSRVFQQKFHTVDRVFEIIVEELQSWRAAGCVASL
ncbi:hypothetical protein BRADI_3g04093v3 [Brachypodium distachyon]|uniref:Uncharacterized protein n=1 Tax=Brachypodium distachyon TaxID=15368 RepID=A0A0Q3F1G3_BRADI|nr:hypothetical protein BRADI_3g04093v3 [Brachypodium distachyon]